MNYLIDKIIFGNQYSKNKKPAANIALAKCGVKC